MKSIYVYQLLICVIIYFMGVAIGRASVRIDYRMKYTEPSDADFYSYDRHVDMEVTETSYEEEAKEVGKPTEPC